MKKEWEKLFLTLLKNILNQIRSTWQITTVAKKSTFIVYLDSKNLNGWAMVQYLPDGGFKWLTQKEIDKFDVISIS